MLGINHQYRGFLYLVLKVQVSYVFLLLLNISLTYSLAFAADLLITWDQNTETDLAGYKIYERQLPSLEYGVPIFSGQPSDPFSPSHVISNVEEGFTYGYIITAFDTSGNESTPSIEDQITIAPPPPSSTPPIQINFQPTSASIPSGYLKDDGSIYSSTRGYGWSTNLTSNTRDRNSNPDQRLDSFLFVGSNSTATWQYDLPNGDYLISLASGDPSWSQGPQRLLIEDQVVFNNLTSTPNSYLSTTDLAVTVTDGTLTVTLGASSGLSLLNYIQITPTTSSEPPPPPPSSTPPIQINFQPTSASIPSGYLKDDGSIYSSTRGYGWSTNLTSNTRDRNSNPDQRLDSFLFVGSNSTATWQYDLPNGDYLISLASGDPSWSQGPQRLLIEDQVVFNNLTSTPNSYLSTTDLAVTVTDGTLTVTLGASSGLSLLNYIQITPTTSSEPPPPPPSSTPPIQINFQPTSASIPSGYLKDDGSIYSSTRGYGWSTNLTSNTRDRNSNPDQRLDSFLFVGSNSTATWQYDLPNGDYLISLASGDPSWSQGPQRLLIEDQVVFNNLTSTPNSYLSTTDLAVTVTDGTLTVTLGASSGLSLLNYIQITPTTSSEPPPPPPSSTPPIQINFQPTSASIPSGYLKDDGSIYSSTRGYGWSTNLTSNTRDRNSNPDQRLDSFLFVGSNSTATWQYDLPNGDYLISLASGDPSWSQGPQRLLIEDQVVFNNLTSTPNSYLSTTDLAVTVTDGTLTVTLGASSGLSLLNYIQITPTTSSEPPPPPPSSTPPIQINFQPTSASIPSGYLKDDGSIYSSTRGYGWSTNLTSNTRDRNSNPDQRLDSFLFVGSNSTATWQYDLPNGDYLISLASGDPSWSQGPQRLLIEDQVVFNNLTSTPNSYLSTTDLAVTVTDGTLTVTLGASSGATIINYVIIKFNN